MAEAAGVSPFHFVRLFRRHFGLTPYQYVIRARLRHAILLLRETSMPVTDIAYEVGFGDLSNFVRTFRHHVGCTPGAFSSCQGSEMRFLLDDLRAPQRTPQ